MSGVSLWEIALTQEQIQDQMSDGLNGDEQNLLAYWKTNSGSGEVLYDHSGNQNHGTINGATWSTDVTLIHMLETITRVRMLMMTVVLAILIMDNMFLVLMVQMIL